VDMLASCGERVDVRHVTLLFFGLAWDGLKIACFLGQWEVGISRRDQSRWDMPETVNDFSCLGEVEKHCRWSCVAKICE